MEHSFCYWQVVDPFFKTYSNKEQSEGYNLVIKFNFFHMTFILKFYIALGKYINILSKNNLNDDIFQNLFFYHKECRSSSTTPSLVRKKILSHWCKILTIRERKRSLLGCILVVQRCIILHILEISERLLLRIWSGMCWSILAIQWKRWWILPM